MSVGKQVFLLAIVTIPTVMRCMTTPSPTVQKAACGRKKSPAVAGKKTAACGRYSPNSVWGFFVPRGGQKGAPYIYNKVEWGGWGGIAVHVVLHSLMLQGDEVNTKSRDGCCRLRLGGAGANVCRKTSFPPCHRHHPHRHALHDDSIPLGSKSGLRP